MTLTSQSWFVTSKTMQPMRENSRYRRNDYQSKQPEAALGVGLHGDHQQPRLPLPHFPAWSSSQNKGEMGSHPARMLIQVLWDVLTHPQLSRKSCTVEIQIEYYFQVMTANLVSMPTFPTSLYWEHFCHNFDKQTNLSILVYILAILEVLWI